MSSASSADNGLQSCIDQLKLKNATGFTLWHLFKEVTLNNPQARLVDMRPVLDDALSTAVKKGQLTEQTGVFDRQDVLCGTIKDDVESDSRFFQPLYGHRQPEPLKPSHYIEPVYS